VVTLVPLRTARTHAGGTAVVDAAVAAETAPLEARRWKLTPLPAEAST
jgi:hypothetical protein